MEQHDSLRFDDVNALIADLETEFGAERLLPTAQTNSWYSAACETGLGGSL